jgi:hypothetical protein
MSNHTLSYKEIMSIPAGRIMNTFVQEYVLGGHPGRWSNGEQKEVFAHWFEEHPRSCAEDDGGYCSADGIGKYSTDISAAMSLTEMAPLKGKSLSTKTEQTEGPMHRNDVITTCWATFSNIPFSEKHMYTRWPSWASGETLALAICRAALLAV